MKNCQCSSKVMALTKLVVIILVITFSLLDGKHGYAAGAAVNITKIKIGNTQSLGNPVTIGADFLAKEIDKETNGSVKAQVFPSSQLGGEREMVEGLQSGSIEMVIVNTVAVSVFSKKLQFLGLPFLFSSTKEVSRLLSGPIGEELFKELESKNIKVTGVWRGATRDIATTKKPVNEPRDLKGLRIRSMETPVTVDFLKAMGALPIILPSTDVFIAMQTGTIDGSDVATVQFEKEHWDDVAKNLAHIKWSYGSYTVIANKAFWEKLNPNEQKAIRNAVAAAGKLEDDEYENQENNVINVLKSRKVNVTTPNVEDFKKAVSELYSKKWEPAYGKDLIEKIRTGK